MHRHEIEMLDCRVGILEVSAILQAKWEMMSDEEKVAYGFE